MNYLKNILTTSFLLFLALCFTGCFEEEEKLYKVLGGVATIPVFTISKSNPTASEGITVTFRYYSENAAVTNLRLKERIGAGELTIVETVPVSSFDTKNSYVHTFNYTVPNVSAGTVIRLEVEVETVGNLVNTRFGNITVAP
jgi:hypothetical protein